MDLGYLWDERKAALVEKKHGVDLAQAVEALCDPDQLYDEDPQGDWGRFMIVGRTRHGKLLQVILSDEELPVMRLITAFEADAVWRQAYERRED